MRRGFSSGFSQLELIIALAVMALMAGLLGGSFDLIRVARENADRAGLLSDSFVSREQLRRWAENIPSVANTAENVPYFEGDRQTLTFVSIVSDGSFWSGELTQVTVSEAFTTGGRQLTVGASGRHPSKSEQHSVLMDLAGNADGLTLSYFGKLSYEDDAKWHSNWSDGRNLPQLVKVEFFSHDGLPIAPLTFVPAKRDLYRYMSLSSLLPPA